ncbi:MAG: hypothetical protein HYW95_02560 [Candidatus Wildermuthbacteria bacterium]|nr:hypothetical protein [Candidatus Wildermuthbacteria bacterium]
MTDDIFQTIERIAKELFEKLGLEGQIKVSSPEEGVCLIEIKAEDPNLFIGEQGKVLLDIQYILRLIIKKQTGENIRIAIDINEYRKNKELYLRELARTTADEVALLKYERELPPMSAADRRIIHTELSNRTDITSESVGEEPNRRIVIKPKGSGI